MGSAKSANLLEILARRGELLNCLWDGIEDKRKLEERLGQSRSTLNRGLNDLKENHLIVERPDCYAVTPAGEVARHLYARIYEPFAEALPLLSYLSLKDSVDPMFVYSGYVIRAEHPNPDAPIDQLRDLITDGSRVKAMSPIGLIRHLDFFQGQNVEDGSVAEFVFDEECLQYLQNTYSEKMQTAIADERCTFWKSGEIPPFSLFIIDDATAWLGIHDAEETVKGAIVNDSNIAIDWACNVYRQYRRQSEQVTS